MEPRFEIRPLGRLPYAEAYEVQTACVEQVLAWRETGDVYAPLGVLLTVEHEPVITISKRPAAAGHVLASEQALERAGVEVRPTDRGGDVTYHGPGQLVLYPIVDLNRLGCRIHQYLRLLEGVVIDTLGAFGVSGERDDDATGVWVRSGETLAKVASMGVRVRRWVSMHGLSLNVDPDMAHFGLIVPCGLAGRPVTSLRMLLGAGTPDMEQVRSELIASLERALLDKHHATARARGQREPESDSEPGGSQR
ncbi:MAG: lipoyl(octanoyl) transferase LipB [Planctomycetota bacterium]